MTLDDAGPGVMTQRYHNKGRLIMLEANCIKFSLDIQNSLGIIMCNFHAFQSKTQGMTASVRIIFEHPWYIDTLYKVIHRCVMESSNLRLFIILKLGGHSLTSPKCKILRLNVTVIFYQLNFSDMKNMKLKKVSEQPTPA